MPQLTSQKGSRIKITGLPGFRSLWVGGFPQSGGLYHWIWRRIVRQLNTSGYREILLLGLGGGTAIKHLRHKYPLSHFTALELDPEIVLAAKKYFLSTEDLRHISIVTQNAKSWLTHDTSRYDLIIVDLYSGDYNPPFTRTPSFLRQLKSRLNPMGQVIFNAHYHPNHIDSYRDFLNLVKSIFSSTKLLHSGFHHRYLLLS